MNFNTKLPVNILLPSFLLTIYAGVVQAACIQGDCNALGYTKNENNCDGDIIRCPFDTSKVFCKEKTLDDECAQYKESPWVVNGDDVYSKCQALSMLPSGTTTPCGGITYHKCQTGIACSCPSDYKNCTSQMRGHSNNVSHCNVNPYNGNCKCVKIMDSEGINNGCDPCSWCRQTYSCQMPSNGA